MAGNDFVDLICSFALIYLPSRLMSSGVAASRCSCSEKVLEDGHHFVQVAT